MLERRRLRSTAARSYGHCSGDPRPPGTLFSGRRMRSRWPARLLARRLIRRGRSDRRSFEVVEAVFSKHEHDAVSGCEAAAELLLSDLGDVPSATRVTEDLEVRRALGDVVLARGAGQDDLPLFRSEVLPLGVANLRGNGDADVGPSSACAGVEEQAPRTDDRANDGSTSREARAPRWKPALFWRRRRRVIETRLGRPLTPRPIPVARERDRRSVRTSRVAGPRRVSAEVTRLMDMNVGIERQRDPRERATSIFRALQAAGDAVDSLGVGGQGSQSALGRRR